MKANFIFLLIACLAMSHSSCLVVSALKNQADVTYGQENKNEIFPDGSYTGLAELIDSNVTTNIIMVHGLKTKSENHFAYLRKTIVSKLGFTNIGVEVLNNDSMTQPNDTSKIRSLPGKVNKYVYHKDQGNKTLIIYDINWSPVTAPAKDYIKYEFDEPRQQTRLAKYLKDEYLIDVFGDMALYLNKDYKAKIQEPFSTVLKDLKGDNNVVIAGGFGSQILFDVLTKSTNNWLAFLRFVNSPIQQEAAIAIAKSNFEQLEQSKRPIDLKKIKHIFLLSNQLPFTSLMELPNNTPNNPESYVGHLFKNIDVYANIAGIENLNIVSFYESNDAFGYKLPKPLPSQGRINLVNVQVENAYSLSFNPDKLTRDFLSPRISDPKLKNVLYQLIDQENTKQKLMFNIEGPGDFARYSEKVVDGLVKMPKNQKSKEPEKVKDELSKAFANPPKPNKGAVRRFFENRATCQLKRVLKEIDKTNATLPFRLPSSDISYDIEGIRMSVQSNEVTQVLAIHGMRYPKPNHYDEMFTLMARQLDFYTTPTCDVDYYFDQTGHTFPKSDSVAGNGSVRVVKFENANGKSLVFYSVYWAPITLPPKQWLNNICKDGSASVTSQLVKEEIVNDGLGDVILAFNGFGGDISKLLDLAINLMNVDSTLCKIDSSSTMNLGHDNVYMISSSLGSRILYEYLVDRTKERDHPINGILKRTDKIFMLTNQIGLIEMKNFPSEFEKNYLDQKLFETFRNRLDSISANVEIIAFNDPNDILSFRVPELDTTSLQVKHIYINLAQGFQVNMNGLIKWMYKEVDKRISGTTFWGRIFENERSDFCKAYYEKLENQYCSGDILRDTRFFLFKDKEFKIFKEQLQQAYKVEKDSLKNQPKSDERKQYLKDLKKSKLRNKNLKKLKKKTILMPLLRTVVNGKAYQDFVVDLNTAHTGPKKNHIIIQMMCDGSRDVRRTNTRNE